MFDKIEIEYFDKSGFSSDNVEGIRHSKALPFLSIVQAVEGHYGISLNGGREYDTGEGGFFIAPTNAAQTITHHVDEKSGVMTARWVFMNVRLDGSYLFDDIFGFPAVLPEEKNAELGAVFDEVFGAETACDRYIACYKIIKILLSVAERSNAPIDPRIAKAFGYIRSNYPTGVTVDELAASAYMSGANFYRLFKRQTGASPIKYLNNYRLSLAASMLLATDKSVKSVAEAVGIHDSVYFNKLFKRNYKMPPTKYRAVYKKNQSE